MSIIPLLVRFVAATLFKRGELNITSSSFNPVKFFTTVFVIIYLITTLLIINNLMKVYHRLEFLCPGVIKELHSADVNKPHTIESACLKAMKQKNKAEDV